MPISQYDPAQYSADSCRTIEPRRQAAIFTMIGRAIATDKTVALYIDGFWNAEAADKQGASDPNRCKPKVTFSDGAGQDVVPDESNAFKIVAGTTDLGALLAKGPLMIQRRCPERRRLRRGCSRSGSPMTARASSPTIRSPGGR